jgi:hypothetical protein
MKRFQSLIFGLALAWLSRRFSPRGRSRKPLRGHPSFSSFDRRAKAGENLNVVFFGASWTWGANASDPLRTSYRAVVAQKMKARYPRAHFEFSTRRLAAPIRASACSACSATC